MAVLDPLDVQLLRIGLRRVSTAYATLVAQNAELPGVDDLNALRERVQVLDALLTSPGENLITPARAPAVSDGSIRTA